MVLNRPPVLCPCVTPGTDCIMYHTLCADCTICWACIMCCIFLQPVQLHCFLYMDCNRCLLTRHALTLQCSPWLGVCELHITVQTSHGNCTIGTAYTRRTTPLNLTLFCTPTATLLSCTPCCTLIAHCTDIAPYVHCPFQAPLVLLYQGVSQFMISVQWHRSRVTPQSVESASVSQGRL